ncbi:hypothetical protein HpMMM46_07380 [Helicobacter pylori]
MKITLSKTIKKHANDISPMAHNEIFKNDILRVRNNHSYEEFSNISFNANANSNPYLNRYKFHFL